MELNELVKNPDSWYDAFEGKSKEEQYDFVLATLEVPLTEDFAEQTDLAGLLIEVVGLLFKRLTYCGYRWPNSGKIHLEIRKL